MEKISSRNQTQCDHLLALLQAHAGQWVALPDILALGIAQYNARIHELRRRGLRIPPPRTETVNGKRHTWYRLETRPERAVISQPRPIQKSAPATEPQQSALASTDESVGNKSDSREESRLFPDDAPRRHLDLG